MIDWLISVFIIFMIYLFIETFWEMAEKILYGKSTPRKIDGLIALILAISLFYNLK